jgi:hypothetical protein
MAVKSSVGFLGKENAPPLLVGLVFFLLAKLAGSFGIP